MIDVKAIAEPSTVNYPYQFLIKGFAREPFRVRHCRMLEFNDYACWCHYIGPVNLAVRRSVGDFAALFGKSALPFPVPIGFVSPPGITIFAACMGPVMDHAGAAFRCGRRTADRTFSSPVGKCFASFRIYQRVLQSGVSNFVSIGTAPQENGSSQSDDVISRFPPPRSYPK